MAQQKFHASSRDDARAPSQLWLKLSWLPPRFSAPMLGLKPTQPQKLAGRIIEPTTCVPRAAASMPLPTAAPEPLLEPPGVHAVSQGLRVPAGCVAANSVVTVLPTMTAPASRNAATVAASRSERQPL